MFFHSASSLLHVTKGLLSSIYPRSTKLVQIEPNLPTEGKSPKTGNFLHISSSSNGLMEGLVEDSALAGAEVPRFSPESRASQSFLILMTSPPTATLDQIPGPAQGVLRSHSVISCIGELLSLT